MPGMFDVPFDVEGTRPAPAGRSRTVKVLGTLAIASLTVGLAACGDDSSSDGGSSPADAAEGFFGALADEDCSAVEGFLSESMAEDFDMDSCEEGIGGGFEGTSFVSAEVVEEDGSEATVEITTEFEGEETTETLDVVEEDGTWKIASLI